MDKEQEALAKVLQEVKFERSYQDAKWGGPKHDDTHSSFDWIVYLTKYLGQAVQFNDVWTSGNEPQGHKIFRDAMLKIAALAVAAIEWHDRGFGK
jgi:hypothetical protein